MLYIEEDFYILFEMSVVIMKRTISLLLSLLMIFSTVMIYNVSAEDEFYDCNYSFNKKDGVLTISGYGKMPFYYYEIDGYTEEAPWDYCKESVKKIVIKNGITSISAFAFSDCENLTSVQLPNSLKTIDSAAFWGCKKLPSIKIPKSVKTIASNAFSDCFNLRVLSVDKNNINYSSLKGILYNKKKTEILRYAIGRKDSKFVIPNSVNKIGINAFSKAKNLTGIVIPNKVKEICGSAFAFCEKLNNINLPNSIKTIGVNAFTDCDSLSKINLPNSIETIGDSAFINCDSLSKIVIPNKVKKIGDSTFEECKKLYCISVNRKNKYYSSLNGVLYNKTKNILVKCPMNTKIKNFVIPKGTKKIGNSAFYSCKGIVNVTIPYGVQEIDKYAFSFCINLAKVNFPDSIRKIGYESFALCESLVEVKFPFGLTTIGENSFEYCKNLRKITIPNTIKKIRREAFVECDNLKNIIFIGNEKQWYNVIIDIYNDCLIFADVTYVKDTRQSQNIVAKSFTKYLGAKPFNLGAKAKTKLSYFSNNKKVALVSANGKVTIKSVGKTIITIKAEDNTKYKSATKKITVTVKRK